MDRWSPFAKPVPLRATAKPGVMSSLLAKRTFSSSLSYSHQRLPLSPLFLRCSLSTQTQEQPQKVEMPLIAHYLISSFGFSDDWAMKVSTFKSFAGVNTPEQPASVVSFLSEIGLSFSEIRRIISCDPSLLGVSVDEILRPHAGALMDAGFTGEVLAQLIQSNPQCLCHKETLSRLLFWRNFVGDNDEVLLKILQKNRLLLWLDIDDDVLPRVNLLKEFGLLNKQIANLLVRGKAGLFRSLESLREILERTEELGFTRGSTLFVHGLQVIDCCSKETIARKVEFFKETYGWSDEEVSLAFRKFPYILGYSEERVKPTMDFLIRTAKLDPRSIASQPVLLSYSLERRLIPRHHVLSILESNGLKKTWGLLGAITISEERFIKRFVVPYEKDVPGIRENYVAARGGKVQDLEMVLSANLQQMHH